MISLFVLSFLLVKVFLFGKMLTVDWDVCVSVEAASCCWFIIYFPPFETARIAQGGNIHSLGCGGTHSLQEMDRNGVESCSIFIWSFVYLTLVCGFLMFFENQCAACINLLKPQFCVCLLGSSSWNCTVELLICMCTLSKLRASWIILAYVITCFTYT